MSRQGIAEVTELSVLSRLQWLEAEAFYIIREAVAEAENPVMLHSVGKDIRRVGEVAKLMAEQG